MVDNDSTSQQQPTLRCQKSISVNHEDLRPRSELSDTHIVPEAFTPYRRSQRPGSLHLASPPRGESQPAFTRYTSYTASIRRTALSSRSRWTVSPISNTKRLSASRSLDVDTVAERMFT